MATISVGGRHLEIELRLHARRAALDVGVLDVAAVLAQVHGDAVGAAALRRAPRLQDGSGYGVRRAWRRVATWSMLTPRRIGRAIRRRAPRWARMAPAISSAAAVDLLDLLAFDHDPQQRLGAGVADQHAPARAELRPTASMTDWHAGHRLRSPFVSLTGRLTSTCG